MGQNLQLDIRRSMRKVNVVRGIAEHMSDNDVFEEETLSQLQVDTQELPPMQKELEKTRIATGGEIEKARIG